MSGTTVDRLNGITDGVAVKAPCRAATTANITLSGEQTIDGVAVVAGNRVLVKNQTDTTTNGIYTASTGTWTRAYDFDGTGDIVQGTQVFVVSGTANANTRWQITTASPAIGSALAFDTTAASSLDINGLTAETAPAVADTVPIYDASAAANRKMTLENVVKIITLLTAETAPAVGDEIPIYDASAAAPRKMTLENALKVIASLTGLTAPAVDDVLAIYDLSATAMRGITVVDLLEVLNVLTEDTTPDGAADFVLTYDASAATVKKVKPNNLGSSGGATLIASGSLTGTAVSITNIPATYAYLVLQITGASSDTATRKVLVRVDTDNGASYDATAANYRANVVLTTTWAVATLASLIESQAQAAAGTTTATIILKAYQGNANMRWEARFIDTTSGEDRQQFGTFLGSTAAINAIQILWDGTGSFDAGTYALYGDS